MRPRIAPLHVASALLLWASMETVPAWKFWHPLPFWQVIVIYLLVNLAFGLAAGGLGEAGVHLPGPGVGAAGSLVSYFVVLARARRTALTQASPKP